MNWDPKVANVLKSAGWHEGRRMRIEVLEWKAKLSSSSGFKMSQAAEDALLEFGKIKVELSGPGIDYSQTGFEMDPMLALGEEDRFAGFDSKNDLQLFPLGEVGEGQAFFGIAPNRKVYLVGDKIEFMGKDIFESLESLVLGKRQMNPS